MDEEMEITILDDEENTLVRVAPRGQYGFGTVGQAGPGAAIARAEAAIADWIHHEYVHARAAGFEESGTASWVIFAPRSRDDASALAELRRQIDELDLTGEEER